MSQTVAIYNFKGGVGKTTSALNLAISWSRSFKVLLIDMDPQCNLTNAIGKVEGQETIFEHLRNIMHGRDDRLEPMEVTPYLHLIPGDFRMSELEANNQFISFGSSMISKMFFALRREYDFIVIDCPTNFGVIVKTILGSSENILIPALADSFSLTGIDKLMSYLGEVENQQLNILGVFFNMFNGNLNLSKEKEEEARRVFGKVILETTVSRSVRVGEANNAGQSITDYSPDNNAAKEFMQLSDELMEKFHARLSHTDIHNLKMQA